MVTIMIRLLKLWWALLWVMCWLNFLWVFMKKDEWISFSFVVLYFTANMLMILCLFNSEQNANQFFKFLNSQHPNIKFKFTKWKDDKLAFLNELILKTTVYCKMASIGLYINFLSFTPYSYKIGLIKTLIPDTYEISSSCTSFNVKKFLMLNIFW